MSAVPVLLSQPRADDESAARTSTNPPPGAERTRRAASGMTVHAIVFALEGHRRQWRSFAHGRDSVHRTRKRQLGRVRGLQGLKDGRGEGSA